MENHYKFKQQLATRKLYIRHVWMYYFWFQSCILFWMALNHAEQQSLANVKKKACSFSLYCGKFAHWEMLKDKITNPGEYVGMEN